MIERLAMVAWWSGRLWGWLMLAVAVIVPLVDRSKDAFMLGMMAVIVGIIGFTAARAVSFVLGGSFWDRPSLEDWA